MVESFHPFDSTRPPSTFELQLSAQILAHAQANFILIPHNACTRLAFSKIYTLRALPQNLTQKLDQDHPVAKSNLIIPSQTLIQSATSSPQK